MLNMLFNLGNERPKPFWKWKQQECESYFSKMNIDQKSLSVTGVQSDDKKA